MNFQGRNFATKKDLGVFIKNRIYEIGFGDFTENDSEFDFFIELLKRHSYYDKFAGIKTVHTTPNVFNPESVHMEVTTMGGKNVAVSWNKCINPKLEDSTKIQVKNLSQAMRNAIYKSTSQFKQNSVLKCVLCQATNLPTYQFHTDHLYPSFKKIRDDFVAMYEEPTEFDRDPRIGGSSIIFKEEDMEWENLWKEYHDSIATYQILCRTCNTKKH